MLQSLVSQHRDKEEMAQVREESPPVAEEKAATPQVAPASRNSVGSQPVQAASNALNLSWAFGVNKNVPTINLTDHHRQMVLYTCGNTAVLYDYAKNTQRLLQGHANDICCTCASQDKRWVVTGDKGINSMVIIWDSYTGTPVQTIFDAYPDIGVACMAMTPDAKYLVTISTSPAQTVSLWDWTTDGETPICSCELSESYGMQSYVYFNPEDTTQLVSNSDNQVIFYSWKGGELVFFAPPLTDQEFNRVVGNYSQSIFCSNSSRALTATSVGNVVVWDNNRPNSGVPSLEPSPNKKCFKLVRLQEKGITVLTTTDRYVVTGDVSGHVKFYDQQLRMSNWYNEFGVGPINSISFAYAAQFTPLPREDSDYPPDATINASQFVTRNYTLSTTTAQVALIVADGSRVKMIHAEHDAAIHSMAAHPTEPFIAIGSYSGLLKIWNYKTKTLVASRTFPRGHLVRCLAFDPKGMYLGIGFTNGYVYILDSLTLDNEVPEPFRYSRDAVMHCTFSLDSQWMATADADYCVTLFKREAADSEYPWSYLGKHRAHYKPIRGLSFGLKLDTTAPRLISVGEDRSLVEYDLINSDTDDLKLVSCERIEQSAIPQCIAWHPPITKEQFFLLANDQFKFKLYNTTTKMCRQTLLGPTYGTPLQKIEVLPTADEMEEKRYLAYITTDKVGLHIMPLDGNPHNSIARIAHPSGVTNMVCSHDGKHVFTAGGSDASVSMWDVAIEVIEAGSQLGGEGLIPFYGLLEGGREGELFKELENYFYYAQIRSQGVDTMAIREVSTQIPLSEIPFVMRAMGHYPSEQEIEDMISEIKFSRYVDTGEYVSHIDLGTFIKLYVNHRPAFGLSATKLYEAFEVLGLDEYMGAPAVDRGELLDILQTKGEHMTEAEVAEYITTLLGLNPEGGSSEIGSYDAAGAAELLEEALPEQVTADMFTSEVLGFGGPVEVSVGSASTMFE
ncbi:cilia- and flagella-associated protein 251-like [Amphiura filiformis]|uniref:cilia- and flagella-associated protein 251-like n=1 Tax=Amphiura filiformis TaxID=82378 RepID=UPI003B20EB4A